MGELIPTSSDLGASEHGFSCVLRIRVVHDSSIGCCLRLFSVQCVVDVRELLLAG